VCFTVAQPTAVAHAVERRPSRRADAGADLSRMAPVRTTMVGRLDDWLKVLVERDHVAVDPAALDWAGIAVSKRAYEIFRQRGYRSRLLAAARRHRLHWTELVGSGVIVTRTHQWQPRFNVGSVEPSPRIGLQVDPRILSDPLAHFPDIRRAYDLDGLNKTEFDGCGTTVRTLRSFISAYQDLTAAVRDVVLPDPAIRARPTSQSCGRVSSRGHGSVHGCRPRSRVVRCTASSNTGRRSTQLRRPHRGRGVCIVNNLAPTVEGGRGIQQLPGTDPIGSHMLIARECLPSGTCAELRLSTNGIVIAT